MRNRKQPARLEKEETISVMEFLNKENTFSIKNWLLYVLFMIIVFAFCFIVKGPTYGYL